jgi:glycosyltransferase involved in cell wall biosynthesis
MKDRLSILFGITSRSWGGNEKWAAEAARGLLERGHRVLAFWSYAPIQRELRARSIPGSKIRLWGDVNPVGLTSLVRLLRRERPDVIVLTKQREYWMGGLAARIAGRPLVVLRHGLRRPLVNDFKRRSAFGSLADIIIVNSESVRDALLEAPWLDRAKVRVIYNGVATDSVEEGKGRRLLERMGVPPGVPVVCGAGRLTKQKGLDILIRAFPRIARDVPGARLVILGKGGQRAALEEEAERSGQAGSIIFPGHRSDVRAVLSGVDVYVLSSRNEGMANTLLEAMSVGAPIVAARVAGTEEAVRDGVDALVAPPEDPDALAEAAVRLLSDRDLAGRLGTSALARARSMFSQQRMLDALEALFREAGAGRAAAENRITGA